MKNMTLKRFLKLGWTKGWTEKEEKAHKAAYLLGIQAGIKQVKDERNARRRLNRLVKKIAR
jgi:hypothetical protein